MAASTAGIMLATVATFVVILVYMLVMAGSIRYYLTEKRVEDETVAPMVALVTPW